MNNILKYTYWEKLGLVYKAKNESSWWKSHTISPTPFLYNKNTIRIFVGCLDEEGISRIGYIDVDASNPLNVKNVSKKYVLDVGKNGCFDDGGVIPNSISKIKNGCALLYYTGIQRDFNLYKFAGSALSIDFYDTWVRTSNVPILDRNDDGLFSRTGLSIYNNNICYSVASKFKNIFDKKELIYNLRYINNKYTDLKQNICPFIDIDFTKEYSHENPQLFVINDILFVFYFVKKINGKHCIGCAYKPKYSDIWIKCDNWLESFNSNNKDNFDNNMKCYPSIIKVNKKIYMFYSGNNYGEDGIGVAELNYPDIIF